MRSTIWNSDLKRVKSTMHKTYFKQVLTQKQNKNPRIEHEIFRSVEGKRELGLELEMKTSEKRLQFRIYL